MIESTLKQIGLTSGEVSVYLALFDLGVCSTGKITQRSGISGSKVYEVLDRLMKKGLVTSVTKNGVRYFEAASPERILEYVQEKRQSINDEFASVQKIVPQLFLRKANSPKSKVRVFTGFEGLKTANQEIIDSLGKGDEWLSMGLTAQPLAWEIYFNKKQQERANKGIIQKHLLNEKYKAVYQKRKRLVHTQFRFLSKTLEMPTSTEVFGDKVCIMIMLQEDPFAVTIESKAVADSFRKYFYLLWNQAK